MLLVVTLNFKVMQQQRLHEMEENKVNPSNSSTTTVLSGKLNMLAPMSKLWNPTRSLSALISNAHSISRTLQLHTYIIILILLYTLLLQVLSLYITQRLVQVKWVKVLDS